MNRYKVTKMLGDGTFGCVMKGKNKGTGEWVAIKPRITKKSIEQMQS